MRYLLGFNTLRPLFTITRTMDLRGRIVVYSIVGCPHCMQAKNTLTEKSLPYTDISLSDYPQCRGFVKEKTGKQTVPQIFFNSTHIGGNAELQTLITENGPAWEKLLEDVKHNEPPADAPKMPDPSLKVKDTDGEIEFICEPDEYAKLVEELKKSGLIKDHRKGLTVHRNSFIGKEFVDWVVKTKNLSRATAVNIGQQLIDQHFGNQVDTKAHFLDDSTYYRLIEDDDSSALNAGGTSSCQPRPASELGEDLRKLILKIYNAHLSPDGKKVDYKGIANNADFATYMKLTKELVRVQIERATRETKLAFFINIYNALVIHANVVKGPPVNLWQRYKFFNTVRYIIAGHSYSLQDIENGVLRANRKGVGMFSKPFGKTDARLTVALSEPEPLIHFALVCGAKSCPPIKTYSSDDVMAQLKVAAESFLEGDDGISINMAKKEVSLSQIFKWYKPDFGDTNEEVVQWIKNAMGDGEKRSLLVELLLGSKFKVTYQPYDWGVNSK